MIRSSVENIAITGIACAVPKHIRQTDEFKNVFGDETVEKFKAMVGVQQCRIASEQQTASDFAYVAAVELMTKRSIDPCSIGALVFVTQTPDYKIPATACVLQKRLHLSKDCIAFDMNLGCSGYVYGLNVLSSLMLANHINCALLLVGDTLHKAIAPNDKSSCMLFGDSGAATLLEYREGAHIQGAFRTDGNGFKSIIIPSGGYRDYKATPERTLWTVDENVRSGYDLYMNGTDVFSFTISEVPKLINEYMADVQKTADDYACFAMHQANCFILKQIAKKAKLPVGKMPISMDRYGNTSVTSIPLTLCDAYAGKKMGKMHTMLCGFGIGLSWGVIDTSIESEVLYPIIESDEYYTDGGVSHD